MTPALRIAAADHRRVGELAEELRAGGARWIVALLHEGVEWWPSGTGIATRPDRLEALVRPWAGAVDLILAGHDFGAWTGTPAGEPYLFASSVVVADLNERAVVLGVQRVRPTPPPRRTAAVEAIEAAAAGVAGESAHDRAADPQNRDTDGTWWNWCRMPAGVSAGDREPRALAVVPFVTHMLSEWLGRDIEGVPAGVSAHAALLRAVR
jgi:hypothetical protein